MAKRDPEITARNKRIAEITGILKSKIEMVLKETGFGSEASLHGKIGGKFADYIDIKNEIIVSHLHFTSLWLTGFKKRLNQISPNSNETETFNLIKESKVFQEYLLLFLERTYLKYYGALSRKKPKIEEAEIWIGEKNADYGLLITPRFKNGDWENDKSEIRHFPKKYWSIGHILRTGLVIPHKNTIKTFNDVHDYLDFIENVIVRKTGSNYQIKIAEMYSKHVLTSSNQQTIPLLLPEVRYEGRSIKHKHRLDFVIIDAHLNKIGFEFSPWRSHGYLTKTKDKTQKEINLEAKANFEYELEKQKAYFRKHGIFSLIYTDQDLADLNKIFEEIKKYLAPNSLSSQLNLYMMNDFLR